MKVSIIIPSFNEEQYIGNLLESLKKQTVKDFEVIVVDANSKDKTREIAKKYGAKVIIEKRRGIGLARNVGAKSAKGETLIFLDADVVVPKNFVKKVIKNIKGASLVQLPVMPDKGNWFVRQGVKIFNKMNKFLIKYAPKIAVYYGGCFIVKKKVFDQVGGFDPKRLLAEDFELATRIIPFSKPKWIDNITIKVSMRRAEKWGWVKFLSFHIRSGLSSILLKKQVGDYSDYEPIR